MAKDSNKNRVLQRRKQELDHALKNAYPPEVVQVRAEKLRAAAIAVLKKYGGPFSQVKGTWNNIAWTTIRARWEALSISEIVGLASRWGTHLKLRDLQIGDNESGRDVRHAGPGTEPDLPSDYRNFAQSPGQNEGQRP